MSYLQVLSILALFQCNLDEFYVVELMADILLLLKKWRECWDTKKKLNLNYEYKISSLAIILNQELSQHQKYRNISQ